MKKALKTFLPLLFTVIVSFAICSCRTSMPVAQSGGSGDYASILIVSAQDHINKNVDVKVDAQTLFVAKAVKFKDKNVGGKSYQIPSGKHKITVSRNGNILYNKFIFASPKETKIINIP